MLPAASPRSQAAAPPVMEFEGSYQVQAPKREFQWNVARMFRRQATESTEHAAVVGLLSFFTGTFILAALSDFLIRAPLYLAGKINGRSFSLIDKVTPPLKALAEKVGCIRGQKLLPTDEERSKSCLSMIEKNVEQYVKQSGKNGDKGLRDEAFTALRNELEIYFRLNAKSVGPSLNRASETLQDLLMTKVAAHTKVNGRVDQRKFDRIYPKINGMFQEVRAERFIKLAEKEDNFVQLLQAGLKSINSHELEDGNAREAYLSREQLGEESVRKAIVADAVKQASKGGIDLNTIIGKVDQTFAPLAGSFDQKKLARMRVKALNELNALKTAQDLAAAAKAEKVRLKKQAISDLRTFLNEIHAKTDEINDSLKATVRKDKRLQILYNEVKRHESLRTDCQERKKMLSKHAAGPDDGGFSDAMELDETIAIYSEDIERFRNEIDGLSKVSTISDEELRDEYTDLIRLSDAYNIFSRQNGQHIGKKKPAGLLDSERAVVHNIGRIQRLYSDRGILPDVPKFRDDQLQRVINRVMNIEDDPEDQLAPPPAAAPQPVDPAPALQPDAAQVPVDAQPAAPAPAAAPQPVDPAPALQPDAAQVPVDAQPVAPAPAAVPADNAQPVAPAPAAAPQPVAPAPVPVAAPIGNAQPVDPAPLPDAAQVPVDAQPAPAPHQLAQQQPPVAELLSPRAVAEDLVAPASVSFSLWHGLTSMFQGRS